MARLLFVATHYPGRAPGQRFRFEQYRDHLSQNGLGNELSNLIDRETDRFFGKPGHYLKKARALMHMAQIRQHDLDRLDAFDAVFCFREALLTRQTFFERGVHKRGKPMVFDFDDAIWLPNVSGANRAFGWLKRASKTADLIRLSTRIFAGNAYLADYARQFHDDVHIVPTTIDTDLYRPGPRRMEGPVTIGWSGSVTTIQHFQYALPALAAVKQRFGDRVRIGVIGDGSYRHPDLGIKGKPWRLETELDDLRAFDVGIMPLPDDEWARGKCGLKGLQYMALGIPTVMSPVGVNASIVQDGENGYLASHPDEWVEKLSALVEDAERRKQLGEAGRQRVVDAYSVHAWKDTYLRLLGELVPSLETT